ncbi:hypothetical protein Dimus_036715 [Dionaea muscipula]
MPLKPIEEFRLPMGSSPDEFDESALIVGGLDDCGGLILRGAGPELAGAVLPSTVPPVSSSSSLSTSSQFSVGVRRLAEGDDGSAMAADRMKPDVVYTGVDSDCGKGLGHEILANGQLELCSLAEGLSSVVREVSTEHTGVVDDDRRWGVAMGSLTTGSGYVVTVGAQAEIDSLYVFASPHCLSVFATTIVDDGLVREEVRVSPMAKEALRPQPTDGLWRPPSSSMEPVSEREDKVVPGGVSIMQVVHGDVQSSRTYAYVVHADRRADVELSFISPVDGGNFITMEESDGDAERWGSYFVGYFLQGSLPFGYVRSTVSRLWPKLGLIEVKSLDDGFFVFRFADSFSGDGVLEGGSWLVEGKPILLRKWECLLSFSKETLSRIPVWASFFNIPLEYWTAAGLSKIASVVGRPLHLDRYTASRERLAYARVCIEVDAARPCHREVRLRCGDREVLVKVKFNWFPARCELC